ALRGERDTAATGFQAALALDSACVNATQNIALLEEVRPTEDLEDAKSLLATSSTAPSRIKVAVISLLFNWPTTGGGNVHTAELTQFLAAGGYEVRHFHAAFEPWGIGVVTSATPFPSEPFRFFDFEWGARAIPNRLLNAA